MRDTFMLNYECTVQEGRRKEELGAALARYNEMFVPGSKKILVLVDSDYVRRLEAAYLAVASKLYYDRYHWYPGDQTYNEFLEHQKEGAMQDARDGLERIKAGDTQ